VFDEVLRGADAGKELQQAEAEEDGAEADAQEY